MALIGLTVAADLEPTKFSCLMNYLRTEKLLDRGYRYKATNATMDKVACNAQLEEVRNAFYTKLTDGMKQDDDLSPHVDCIIERLKEFKVAEISMKQIVFENTRNLSNRKRKKAMRAFDNTIEKKMETAVKICLSDETFGDLFDTLYAVSSNTTDSDSDSSEKGPEEDYCTRKHLIDKNFINATVYNVTLNPNNIDVSNLDCDEIVETLTNQAIEEFKEEFNEEVTRPSRKATKCLSRNIRTSHFFEHNMKVVIFGEIGISEENKAEERQKFIDNMKQFYNSILKC